ncbi:hypothetical protein D9M71_796010 [compost metagenome]
MFTAADGEFIESSASLATESAQGIEAVDHRLSMLALALGRQTIGDGLIDDLLLQVQGNFIGDR